LARSIQEWQWDDGNLEELAAHGLERRTVLEVWRTDPRFRPNKAGRAATDQMVGPDVGGRMWVVCILESERSTGVWRAVTGWDAEPKDVNWYLERTRKGQA